MNDAAQLTEITEPLIFAAWRDGSLRLWPDADIIRAIKWAEERDNRKNFSSAINIPLRELGRRVCGGFWNCPGPM